MKVAARNLHSLLAPKIAVYQPGHRHELARRRRGREPDAPGACGAFAGGGGGGGGACARGGAPGKRASGSCAATAAPAPAPAPPSGRIRGGGLCFPR